MNDTPKVVFVYGALRSGTTVFRLMLNSHSQISNPGEMDFLFDHIAQDPSHSTGWRYDMQALQDDWIFKATGLAIPDGLTGRDLLIDFLSQLQAQSPDQILSINLHRGIERVFQALPDAKVLHMLRDPRDVARSSIQMGWAGTLYYGVGHWIDTETTWGAHAPTAATDAISEITYEGLFQDTPGVLQQVCAFFDVPYEASMLSYHENTTYSPPDASLTEQWRRKCAPSALQEVEARAGDLMQKRGYALSQPQTALSALHKARIFAIDRLRLWKFGMARFGATLYWAEKLSRWTKLETLNRRIKLRMQSALESHIK